MKSFVAMALLFCLSTFLLTSAAQTKQKNNQPLPYTDADGYQVLSAVINTRVAKLKTEPVSIFHQTVSDGALTELRTHCLSHIPVEFQGALQDFDTKTKAKLLLEPRFSIHKQYKFVETVVGVHTGTYSVSAVGFDENRSHAIVLVQYLVRPSGSVVVGGDNMVYLLRKTETGWQQDTEASKCGQIY